MFYEMGQQEALEKLGGLEQLLGHGTKLLGGAKGLLSRGGEYLAKNPTATSALRGAGAGAGMGAVTGGLFSDEGNRMSGALRGAAIGGLAGGALGGASGYADRKIPAFQNGQLQLFPKTPPVDIGHGTLEGATGGVISGILGRKEEDSWLKRLKNNLSNARIYVHRGV